MQGLQEECVECGTSTSAGRVHIDRTCRGGVESRLEEEWREGGKGLEQERKEAWMKVPWVVEFTQRCVWVRVCGYVHAYIYIYNIYIYIYVYI